jgi:hypothetical protein
MSEKVCIYAVGPLVRDITKNLMEDAMISRADLFESFPFSLKSGKAKIGTNSDAIILLAEKNNVAAIIDVFRNKLKFSKDKATFYVFPVLEVHEIN